MPIFMDSLLWINKHNSIFEQLLLPRKIETFTLYSIVYNLMIIRNAKECVNPFLRPEQRDCPVTFERLKVCRFNADFSFPATFKVHYLNTVI